MKTLILNGSPRKKGDTAYIIDEISKKLGGEVTVINVYQEQFTPCVDCRYCWKIADCVIKDDMFKCYDLMDSVDNVIISSPVYFSELSGPLLSYVSRFQRYYAEKFFIPDHEFKMKKKKGGLILSLGGDTRGIKRPRVTAEIIFKHINTELVGIVSTLHTNETPAMEDPTIDEQIDALVESLTGV